MSKLLLYLLGFMALTSLHFMFRLLGGTYTKDEVDELIDEVDKAVQEDLKDK